MATAAQRAVLGVIVAVYIATVYNPVQIKHMGFVLDWGKMNAYLHSQHSPAVNVANDKPH